ncbi:MAG: hypothetical protein U9Q08_03940 [Candidatus Omnitrophota bacterium]|nr:hypothetical protein [Candidatus Omnitrophota bacterium]
MKIKWPRSSERGFFALLGLLLVAVMILILYWTVLKVYSGKTPLAGRKTEKALAEQGMDVSNQQAILNSFQEKIRDAEKKLLEHEKKIESLTKW